MLIGRSRLLVMRGAITSAIGEHAHIACIEAETLQLALSLGCLMG